MITAHPSFPFFILSSSIIYRYLSYNQFTGTLPKSYLNLPKTTQMYYFLSKFKELIAYSYSLVENSHLSGDLDPGFAFFTKLNLTCNDFVNPPSFCVNCAACGMQRENIGRASNWNTIETCGDQYCDPMGGENCASCSVDCGAPPCGTFSIFRFFDFLIVTFTFTQGVCGDGVCQASAKEDCKTCFADCAVCRTTLFVFIHLLTHVWFFYSACSV